MATLDQLRALFPNASSDADVIKQAAQDFGISPTEIASEVGFAAPKGGITSNQLSSSVDRYQAGLYGVGEEITKRVGLPTASKWMQGQRETNELQADIASGRARELGAVDTWADVHNPAQFGSYAKGLAIQSLPYAGEALLGGVAARGAMSGTRAALGAAQAAEDVTGAARAQRALNIGSTAGGAAASYPSSVGDILSNQREQSGKTDLGAAAALGVPYAALNALGEGGMLSRASLARNPINLLDSVSGFKGAAARTAASAGKVAVGEGASETGQEVINQLGRMAVDPNATLTSPDAVERYKESFIGGATLGGVAGGVMGGWRRSTQAAGNEVADAIAQEGTTLPAVAPQAVVPPAPMAAPAVSGGTTDIAIAQQQAQQESQQIQQAQAQQAAREQAIADFGITTDPAAKQGQFLGRPIFGPMVNQVADAIVPLDAALDPHQREITHAIIKANADTGNKLVSFSFNANNPQASVQKGFEAIAKTANKFQIAHVQSVEEAAKILDVQSQAAKKNELEQINAIYQALTGEDTSGYIAEQQSKAAKGAKNGKLQATAGVGTVPVEGSTGTEGAGGNGPVRPAEVQPIGTAGVGAGSLGLQTGQPPASGVRASTSAGASVGVSEPVGPGQGQGQVNVQPAATAAQESVVGTAAPRGEPATANAEVPASAIADEIESRLEGTPTLVRNMLRMIYPKSGEGRIEMYAAFMSQKAGFNAQSETYEALGARYGLKASTVKDYVNKDLKLDEKEGIPLFMVRDREKIQKALVYQAQQMGLDPQDMLDATTALLEREVAASEAAGVTDEIDMIVNGMAIQNVKERTDTEGKGTGKIDRTNVTDLAEEGNKMEALMQQYLDLSNELEAATEANDARVEELQSQVDALTAKIAEAEKAEKARVRATAGKQPVKETENAVQVESTDEGNVRQPAGGGEEVGQANAEPQKPARKGKQAKAEVKPNEAPQEVKTTAEQAADAWDKVADTIPGAPKFADLSEDERDTFIEFGPENWSADDVRTELVRLNSQFQETKLQSQSKSFYDVYDLADEFDGVERATDQLAGLNIEHALGYVSEWQTINDSADDAINGEIVSKGGRYTIVLNEAKLLTEGHAVETTTHEIGHAVDMAPHGGIYSSQPEMSVTLKNGKIVPVGSVAREMFQLYSTNDQWNEYLEYPFDTVKFPDLDNHVAIEGELFAQVFSVYVNPKGRARLEQIAPATAAFMSEVIKHVQSTKPLQLQTAPTAAQRTLAFKNRNASQRNQASGNVVKRQESKRLASRSQALSEGLEGILPPAATKAAKSATSTLLSAARNGLLSAGITEDIVNMASKYMRSSGEYLAAQYARQKTRLEFEMRIERIEEAFERLPKDLQGTGANSVNRYILDSTMSKKWGYYPGEHRIGTTLFEVDPDLEKRFKAFPKDAQQVIRDVFEHGYVALKMKQTAVSKAVEREFAEREKAAIGDADMLAQLQTERKEMVKRLTSLQNIDFTSPYAYLGRYGDYVVVAKSKEFKHWEERAKLKDFDKDQAQGWLAENVSNPDHYVVQFVETQGEADQVASELIATGKYDMDGTEAGPKEDVGSYIGSDVHLAVSRLRTLADRQQGEGSEELDKLLSDLYLLTAAENSARKSEFMRKYVSGADANMMRNLATSGRADAHFLSTMEHNDDITDAMEKMRDEARNNRRDAMPLYNELFKRQTNSLNYTQPAIWSRALTQASSAWFLATSPAFYLQQIVQTGVLSLPYMAGRLGYFRSARAVKAAYGDVAELVKGMGISEHLDFNKAPADVRQMLQTLVGMGKIDIGIDADTKARASEHGPVGKVMRKLQNLNSRIEAINRATAAIAAYRGYTQRYGNNPDAATKFAAEVVSNTHGSYDGFNTPRVLNSDFGRVFGQFKRFQIIQLSMLGKLIHTSFKGASAEEKAIARRALGFIGGHMAILGGALGVPFVQQIGALMTKLLGDEDEPDDLEYKLRQMIGDKTMADLLLNGVPAALGVNVGGKLGMGNVASVLPFTDVDLTSRSGYEKMMVGLMGPFFGGLAPKFVDGAGMIAKGEYYKGLELLAPNGIGNAMKGLRYATEGITMRNGDVVLKPEEVSMLDAAFQAVGLPTTTITGRQYAQRTQAEFDKFYSDRAAEVKGAYVNASRDGDTEAMADARKEWENLQASRRKNGYRVQPMSELFKATVAARRREAGIVGGVETNKGNKGFAQQLI